MVVDVNEGGESQSQLVVRGGKGPGDRRGQGEDQGGEGREEGVQGGAEEASKEAWVGHE